VRRMAEDRKPCIYCDGFCRRVDPRGPLCTHPQVRDGD
jgi:hypothetical protein